MAATPVAELRVDPRTAIVYEHGWQSWSPAGAYRVDVTTPRPARARWQTMAFRPDRPAPAGGAQGEGLLAVQPAPDAPVTVWSAPDPHREVPSIRTRLVDGDRLLVEADGEVAVTDHDGDLDAALRAHADGLVAQLGLPAPPTLGTGWCSWYGYWDQVTEADVLANLAATDELDLPIDTVQLDDGYQTDIGDWLTRRTDRFPTPLAALGDRIAATGRTAGIWTAPFCVGADSDLAAAHPDWLVGDAVASDHHWGQRIHVLDVTHPEAAAHLAEVMRTLTAWGFSYHKIDFLYAGAMPGRRHQDCSPLDAYAEGLRIVRDAIGPSSVLLGCGAPLLPSVGRVDAMRTSPDIDPRFEPPDGDVSQPSQRGALLAGRARTWQHGRFWANDPDCILVRDEVEDREGWARYLAAAGGLAVSGDPLRSLDGRGLELTRALLVPPADEGGAWRPDPDDPDAGRLVDEDGAPIGEDVEVTP
jgi:alpha-galactosidase